MTRFSLEDKLGDKNALALLLVSGLGVLVAALAGAAINLEPLSVAAWVLLAAALFGLTYSIANFELAFIGLLIVRSALDAFNPLPSIFALGVEALAIAYGSWLLLRRQPIQTTKLWWFFCGWTIFQGLWVVLLPLGGLGLDGSAFFTGVREWLRILTWVAVYWIALQLKGRFSPERGISMLFFSLVVPLGVASLQVFAPGILPGGLALYLGTRASGTLGHPATFSTFLLLFIALTWWKLGQTRQRLRWLLLLGVLGLFLVSAQALTVLAMLVVMLAVLVVPRLNVPNLIGVALFVALILGLLLSTEIGQERLASIAETPLLGQNIDWSRSVLLSWRDGNSFNWRVAQWTFLLEAWRNSPWLGHGLNTSSLLTVWQNLAHNDYVRALVEQGIVGFLSFLTLLGVQALYLIRLLISLPAGSPKRDLCYVLFAFFLASLLGMVADNLWSHTALYSYWWVLIAMLSWDWQEDKDRAVRSS